MDELEERVARLETELRAIRAASEHTRKNTSLLVWALIGIPAIIIGLGILANVIGAVAN